MMESILQHHKRRLDRHLKMMSKYKKTPNWWYMPLLQFIITESCYCACVLNGPHLVGLLPCFWHFSLFPFPLVLFKPSPTSKLAWMFSPILYLVTFSPDDPLLSWRSRLMVTLLCESQKERWGFILFTDIIKFIGSRALSPTWNQSLSEVWRIANDELLLMIKVRIRVYLEQYSRLE